MSTLDRQSMQHVLAACRANAVPIAQALSACFDLPCRIEAVEMLAWSPRHIPDSLGIPGLAVAFRLGSSGLICAVPQSLPLPGWYVDPDESQTSRLEALAQEWSYSLLPGDLEAEQTHFAAADHLGQLILASAPADHARIIELPVFTGAGGQPPVGSLYVIGPVRNPRIDEAGFLDSAASAHEQESPSPSDRRAVAFASSKEHSHERMRMFKRLPVTVSVRLAEKKIEMSSLLGLTPGALITFSKSCEDLLDLYVNNQLYARGEAVKIGEKFGLKINEVGAKPVVHKRVLNY